MSTARWANVILGAWLFISAFVWHHSAAQFRNTWILGIIIVGLALLAGVYAGFRIGTALAALWLFFSTLFLPRAEMGTVWHNCILAIVVFALALTPGRFARRAMAGGPRR